MPTIFVHNTALLTARQISCRLSTKHYEQESGVAYLDCGQQKIYFHHLPGSSSLPCIVFLHEGLGCCRLWGDFPERLCKATGCSGLIYDRAGHGKSSPVTSERTADYLHQHAFYDLPEILQRLLPQKDYLLFGHSDGGSIALLFGATQPAGLLGILTEAAHVFVEEITLLGIRNARKAYQAGKLSKLATYHGDKLDKLFHDWSTCWLSEEFREWNIEELIEAIRVPVLALQGSEDQYGSIAQLQSITRRIHSARYQLVSGGGHILHKDSLEQMLAISQQFIDECRHKPSR